MLEHTGGYDIAGDFQRMVKEQKPMLEQGKEKNELLVLEKAHKK